MLDGDFTGRGGALPLLVCLHALGMSHRSYDGVVQRLSDRFDMLVPDFPGFGDRSGEAAASVADMVRGVREAVAAIAPAQWGVVGHSMGGKIATILASQASKDQVDGLAPPRAVVLLAGSPPMPEPMDESRRRQMLDDVRSGPLDAAAAWAFLKGNTAAPLDDAVRETAIADLRRASPSAFAAWLNTGSREDWSGTVGMLDIDALVLAGGEDGDLGEAGQRRTNMRIYPKARLQVIPGCAHMLPMEAPDTVADAIAAIMERPRSA